jgi:CHASE3 domain sensor protein
MRRGMAVRMVVAGTLLAVVGTTFAFLLLAMEKVIIDLETGARGHVITGEDRFLEPWNDARAIFPAQARTLERLASDNPDDLRRLRTIVQDVASYIQEYATPLVEEARRNDVSP